MTRWEIFKGWHGEQAFWREVYARTIAGIFTVFVVFVVGVSAGVFRLRARVIVSVLIGVVGLALGLSFFIVMGSGRYKHDPKKELRFVVVVSIALLALLMVVSVWSAILESRK